MRFSCEERQGLQDDEAWYQPAMTDALENNEKAMENHRKPVEAKQCKAKKHNEKQQKST